MAICCVQRGQEVVKSLINNTQLAGALTADCTDPHGDRSTSASSICTSDAFREVDSTKHVRVVSNEMGSVAEKDACAVQL